MRYCLVDTAIGTFGLAWSGDGLRRVLLPGEARPVMEARLSRHGEPATPAQLPRHLTATIESYGEGQRVDFADTVLDLVRVAPFHATVYAEVIRIGWGETLSYGDVAARLGGAGLSRAVGQAMARNPVPLIVPCHRVLAVRGRAGGFSAPGGVDAKLRMLALEGVRLEPPATQLAFGF